MVYGKWWTLSEVSRWEIVIHSMDRPILDIIAKSTTSTQQSTAVISFILGHWTSHLLKGMLCIIRAIMSLDKPPTEGCVLYKQGYHVIGQATYIFEGCVLYTQSVRQWPLNDMKLTMNVRGYMIQ